MLLIVVLLRGFVFYGVFCWCWLLVFVVDSCFRLVVGLIWFWVCCMVGGRFDLDFVMFTGCWFG